MSSPTCVDCLLLAENLRCISLNITQIYTLAMPPVIELLFCVFLISLTWRSRRAHLLLAADGILYFILALVDLLSHVIPAARNSATTSRVAGLFLGSASFVPMLSYTSYLLWLSHREFIPYLPRRHQPVAKYIFIGLIPVVTISNLATSLGISIYNLSLPHGFPNKTESLWLSLGQLSLGLYANYQCLAAFLALYRLFTACFDQRRIDTDNTDERHFFNGTGWITLGIQLGAVECFVGFAAGGFSIPLSRRILRLMSRVCIIIGALKGMDENENFELLNKELVLWRRGKPLSTSHSLIANRRMTIRSSQFISESSPIEKDVEKGDANRRVTVHNEVGGPPVLHIRSSALPPPERAIHADKSRRQSGQNTSAEVLASRNVASPSKSNTRRQSAQIIFDDISIDLELTPSVTAQHHESMLSQGHEDKKFEISALGQQSTRHSVAQSYGEEDAAAGCAMLCASEFKEREPTISRISIPQSAYARIEGPESPWTILASQHNGNYPVQFPVTPTRAGITIYSPTAQLEGESWDSPKRRHRQLLSLHLLERASKAHSDFTARSSQWSTIARSQSSASIRMYGGETVISPRYTSANPGDLSAAALRDSRPQIITDQEHITSPDVVANEFEVQAALNREKALRRLNGEAGV